MPEPEAGGDKTRKRGELNEAQKRRLSITCVYIDGLLGDIERALHCATSESPFPAILWMFPRQKHFESKSTSRIASELLRVLEWQSLKPEPPHIPVSRSVLTDLSYIDNAIEELKPRYLRGSGPVPEELIGELNAAIGDLRAVAEPWRAVSGKRWKNGESVQMSNEPLDQSTAFGFRKSENKQQDKSEAHLGMQADVSNARKQYAISGGGAAKRCHTGFRSTFCFELWQLERPKSVGYIWAKRPGAAAPSKR